MSKIFHIEESVANKISFWHLAAFLVTLPFDFFYSQLVLVSFCLHTAIHCRRRYLSNLLDPALLLICGLFFVCAATITYSSDKPEGLNIITRQLALLIIPIAFSLNGLDLKKYAGKLMLLFAMTCTATVLFLYADAIHTIFYFKLPVSSLFTLAFMNHNFSLPIDLHATYASLYVAFSIIIFCGKILEEKRTWPRAAYLICTGILAAGLLQLSSRAVFIALLLVINIAIPLLRFRGRRRLVFIIVSLSLSSALLYGISTVDSFKVRYIRELKTDLSGKVALVEINGPRMARWELIAGMIRKAPVTGYGTGSEKRMLKESYFRNRLFNSYINEFNTHSEYLSLMMKAGIFGLGLFIYVLFAGFRQAWKQKNLEFMGFLLLIAVVCVSENLLDLNKGVFFYSFFLSLFILKERLRDQSAAGDFQPGAGNRNPLDHV